MVWKNSSKKFLSGPFTLEKRLQRKREKEKDRPAGAIDVGKKIDEKFEQKLV
jgi:hypothetical protein